MTPEQRETATRIGREQALAAIAQLADEPWRHIAGAAWGAGILPKSPEWGVVEDAFWDTINAIVEKETNQ